jgi:hypothetical protein
MIGMARSRNTAVEKTYIIFSANDLVGSSGFVLLVVCSLGSRSHLHDPPALVVLFRRLPRRHEPDEVAEERVGVEALRIFAEKFGAVLKRGL